MRCCLACISCLAAAAVLLGGLAARADAQDVRILQAGDTLTAPGIDLIAAEIAGSGTPTRFVVRVPASSQLSSDRAAMQSLVDLGAAVRRGRPVLVVDRANSIGTTATVLSQFAEATMLVQGAQLADIDTLQFAPAVRAASGCDDGCSAVQTVADAADLDTQLAQATILPAVDGGVTLGGSASQDDSQPSSRLPDDDAGYSSMLLAAAVLLVLAAVAVILLRARRSRSRAWIPRTDSPPQPGSGDRFGDRPRLPTTDRPSQSGPRGRAGDRPRPPRPAGPVVPSGARARVQSEFHPDGYVAVDNYVVRATWADAGSPPPAAGDWVELEPDGSRLLAYRPGAGGSGRGVPHRSKGTR